MTINDKSPALINLINLFLAGLKEYVDNLDDKSLEDAIRTLETCDAAAPVIMALGGGIRTFDMVEKKLKALRVVAELKEALKEL